jgi:hypothetical protein
MCETAATQLATALGDLQSDFRYLEGLHLIGSWGRPRGLDKLQ